MKQATCFYKTLLLSLLFFHENALSQDSSFLELKIDTSSLKYNHTIISFNDFDEQYTIYRFPSKDDIKTCKKYSYLINKNPSKENYRQYYSTACSLWELERTAEAKKMFVLIVNSKEPYYEDNYYHSSDIPGDTTKNVYGYGSYTSNYKNYACRYLTKIYIEEKKFDSALTYLEAADKKYPIHYTCGTGSMHYQSELQRMYATCYDGLGKPDKIIEFLLPDYSLNSGLLIKSIKKVYSKKEVQQYLEKAVKSIQCVADTFQSTVYYVTPDSVKSDEKYTEIKYTSGTATILLFNQEITMPMPFLQNGEVITRERMVKSFKESQLYKSLIEYCDNAANIN